MRNEKSRRSYNKIENVREYLHRCGVTETLVQYMDTKIHINRFIISQMLSFSRRLHFMVVGAGFQEFSGQVVKMKKLRSNGLI